MTMMTDSDDHRNKITFYLRVVSNNVTARTRCRTSWAKNV